MLTATSPPTYQSLNENAKFLVLVTEARPCLPESFWRWTPKSTRLIASPLNPGEALMILYGQESPGWISLFKFVIIFFFLKIARNPNYFGKFDWSLNSRR